MTRSRSIVSRPVNAPAVLTALALLLIAAGPVAAQSAEARRVADAVEAFKAIVAVPEREVTQIMARDAYAVAIIPNARRLGFIVGVQSGKGVMLARGADGAWGSPLFISLSGGSVGWQVGVQSADLVLFFRTKKSVEAILDGAFTMGVDAGVSAGSVGRQAGAQTDADMQAEIYSYSRTRGLFAGVSLSGATLAVDEAANAVYYGRAGLRPRDILGRADLPLSAPAAELRRALEKYAKTAGK
jgi:lipid-binding SYLF domain-containing protein